jgi:hypothetical protein
VTAPSDPIGTATDFSYDEEPTLTSRTCDCCSTEVQTSTGFVLNQGSALAVYWLDWHPQQNEGWLDATLGTWEEPSYPRQTTFGCRIGAVAGQEAPACSLVPAATQRRDAPYLGTKLSPDQARRHPWIHAFWALTDWIILNDPLAHEHLYHFAPRTE